ncbi:MAG: efflux RND transporter periplasmic adaptor subunit [Hyphomicrobiales bacterium]|nr:efflux RND transporter periplasmic adaptor subunit [Hyphomicrobiales bacterium]MBV8664486.1 efflux RND transporter periplasmic adaptor subunit [Hyphomicrobiales bacterium]
MFFRRPRTLAIVAAAVSVGAVQNPTFISQHFGAWIEPAQAQSQSLIGNLLARLRGERLPAGIVETNGRIEATQVDVSSKYPGRLAKVTVHEGDDVTQGQVVAEVSSPEQEAKLRAAQADLQRSKDALKAAEAEIASRQSALDFSKADFERGEALIKAGHITKQTYEQRKRNYEAADAAVKSTLAQRDQAQSAIKNAEAEVDRIQAVLHDLTLLSPRNGRVQYELLREGEVVNPGAPILTVLDLTDVYMTVFLPGADAAKLAMGGEARVVLDAAPDYSIPAKVSFVSPEAQFTPKTVETKNEREKLMFRVKLKIDPDVLKKFSARVKTGVRGMGIVRTNEATPWPDELQVKLPTQ